MVYLAEIPQGTVELAPCWKSFAFAGGTAATAGGVPPYATGNFGSC